jgi:hypothetical protein
MEESVNHISVTGPVVSDPTGPVGTVPVAPPYPSLPGKGERSGGPTTMTPAITAKDTDNGLCPATLKPNLTTPSIEQNDNVLRLRGGGNDEQDDDMELDIDNQEIINRQKRFKSNSPGANPDKATDSIMESLNQIDTTLAGIRTYMADMITSTKIGKKWAGGLENFLSEILVSTKRMALEAVEVIGANKNMATELKSTRREIYDLHVMIGEQAQLDKGPSPRKTYATATTVEKSQVNGDTPLNKGAPPAPNGKMAKGKTNEFPPLERQVSKSNGRKGSTHKKKQDIAEKLNNAKKRPVKPAFIIDNSDDKLRLDDIWKVVSSRVPNPKLDGCRKLPSGDFVLTTSDDNTAVAIRNIREGISIRETTPRKPRVKLKSIPIDYTPEFIAEALIGQNQALTECSTKDIRPLFKCGKRNEYTSDWVIEVTPIIYKAIIDKRTFVGMVSTFPRQYIVAPHCRRCLLTGHKTVDCKAEASTCFHCAKPGHSKKECKNAQPCCAHCGGTHTTLSKDCAKWAARTMALQLKTSYECT